MAETITFTTPIVLSERKFVSFSVKPVMFRPFIEMAQAAANASDENTSYQVLLRRARLKYQVALFEEKGKAYGMNDMDIAMLPIGAAKLIIPSLTKDEGVAGKVLSEKDADGVSKSILYKLGTPITAGTGKPIEELEFLVNTYSDVEAVMAEDGKLSQTLVLIKSVAKPVGMLTMPSWGVDSITVADGMTLLTGVLPTFL